MKKPAMPLTKYFEIMRVSAKSNWTYSSGVIAGMFQFALFLFVFSRVWDAAFAGRTEISGYTYEDCCWYFMVVEICLCGFGRSFWPIAEAVKTGQVAYQLLRPIGFIGYSWAEKMGPAIPNILIYLAEGTAIMALATGTVPSVVPLQAALLAVSVLLAGTIAFFFQAAIALTAFTVEENSAFFWIWQKLGMISGGLLPLEFLPDWLKGLVVFTPFPYQTWAPAKIAVSFDVAEALGIVGAQALWCAAGYMLCSLVYSGGLRKITVQGG